MNKTTVDQLPEPLSRSEEFLDFIARGKTIIDQLPSPQSRIELFLDYIARNGGAGGGNNPGGPITIDQVTGLRDALNAKGDALELTNDKLTLKSGAMELSNVPMITTAEIQLILQNLI